MLAEELTVFIHIPKAEGTTTRSILSNNYSNFMDEILRDRRSITGGTKQAASMDVDVDYIISHLWRCQTKIDCVALNLPYGLHEFLDRSCRYFTILRDPVERCLSLWYEAFRFRHLSPKWALFEALKFDIEAIVASGVAPELSDDQTRMLSGSGSLVCSPTDLDVAISNIESERVLVGLVERYDLSVRRLGTRLGWRRLDYSRLNRGDYSQTQILPEGAHDIFRAVNRHDTQLVKRCRSLIF